VISLTRLQPDGTIEVENDDSGNIPVTTAQGPGFSLDQFNSSRRQSLLIRSPRPSTGGRLSGLTGIMLNPALTVDLRMEEWRQCRSSTSGNSARLGVPESGAEADHRLVCYSKAGSCRAAARRGIEPCPRRRYRGIFRYLNTVPVEQSSLSPESRVGAHRSERRASLF
jgi:hypothetical protein